MGARWRQTRRGHDHQTCVCEPSAHHAQSPLSAALAFMRERRRCNSPGGGKSLSSACRHAREIDRMLYYACPRRGAWGRRFARPPGRLGERSLCGRGGGESSRLRARMSTRTCRRCTQVRASASCSQQGGRVTGDKCKCTRTRRRARTRVEWSTAIEPPAWRILAVSLAWGWGVGWGPLASATHGSAEAWGG